MKSTFVLYCGAYSHTKIAKALRIEISQKISKRECDTLITTNKFRSEEGGTHAVKIGKETIFYVNELGVIHHDENYISCEGQQMKIDNNIINDMMQISQYRIILQKENYVIEDQIEAQRNHIKLPLTCTINKGGCTINDRTYIWDAPKNKCPMKKLRDAHLTRIGTWGIDHQEKILFNITGRVVAPINCPQVELLTTEYKDLYLTKSTKSRDFEMVDEIKIDLFIRNRDDYILWEMESRVALFIV